MTFYGVIHERTDQLLFEGRNSEDVERRDKKAGVPYKMQTQDEGELRDLERMEQASMDYRSTRTIRAFL